MEHDNKRRGERESVPGNICVFIITCAARLGSPTGARGLPTLKWSIPGSKRHGGSQFIGGGGEVKIQGRGVAHGFNAPHVDDREPGPYNQSHGWFCGVALQDQSLPPGALAAPGRERARSTRWYETLYVLLTEGWLIMIHNFVTPSLSSIRRHRGTPCARRRASCPGPWR